MINGKTAIAIIPARGGSKGLPGKNIRSLCGRPLIAWSISKAKASRHVDEVMVSTDSVEIANIARWCGAAVPFMRPHKLATDRAKTFDVVRHALDHYRTTAGREFDYTVVVEPTSPLREDDDIDCMLAALDSRSDDFDGIVSIGEVSHHPSIMKRLTGEQIGPYFPEMRQTTRRQDNAPAYFPFGVAYIVKTRSLLSEETFYPRRCQGYAIKRYQSFEIDDLYDFICVESIMKHEWGLT